MKITGNEEIFKQLVARESGQTGAPVKGAFNTLLDQAARTEPDGFFALTRTAFQQAAALLPELNNRIKSTGGKNTTGWLYRNYLAKQNRAAKIPL